MSMVNDESRSPWSSKVLHRARSLEMSNSYLRIPRKKWFMKWRVGFKTAPPRANSPFNGSKFQEKPSLTFSRGQVAWLELVEAVQQKCSWHTAELKPTRRGRVGIYPPFRLGAEGLQLSINMGRRRQRNMFRQHCCPAPPPKKKKTNIQNKRKITR